MSVDDIFDKYENEIDTTPSKQDNEDSISDAGTIDDNDSILLAAFNLYDFFGLDKESDQYNRKVNEKLAYIWEATGGSLDVLKHTESRIGSPRMGVNLIDHLYQYFKIEQQASDILDKKLDYETPNSDNGQQKQSVIIISPENVGGPTKEESGGEVSESSEGDSD